MPLNGWDSEAFALAIAMVDKREERTCNQGTSSWLRLFPQRPAF
jgi:hypothetical protein